MKKGDSLCDFGVKASLFDLNSVEVPKLPEKADDGRTPTLNGMGCATEWIYGITQDFVNFAGTCRYPVL